MRVFVVIAALLGVSCALPQYGYQPPVYGELRGLSSAPVSSVQQADSNKYLPPATTTEGPLVHKQFFVVSPQDDPSSNQPRVKNIVLGRPQRNYRVVFIKAPAADNVKYTAELAPQEEKTIIYVLSKKAEDLKSEDISTPAPTQPSKPEVFFIKYKTDEEASYAQSEIQGQYDQLGGTNEFNNEGKAPITSIVGSLDGLNEDGSYDYKVIKKGDGTVQGTSRNIDSVANGSENLSSLIKTKYLPAS